MREIQKLKAENRKILRENKALKNKLERRLIGLEKKIKTILQERI
jgi:hypothetical protein